MSAAGKHCGGTNSQRNSFHRMFFFKRGGGGGGGGELFPVTQETGTAPETRSPGEKFYNLGCRCCCFKISL